MQGWIHGAAGRRHRAAACLACWLVTSAALACDDRDDDGLDVALVFSGGGALATTHIGALTVIEELGIPVHCVTGSSMGAVVGALYAAGYRSEELRRVFRDSRWPEVFSGAIPRRDESYLRKEQDDLYLSGYVAGMESGKLRLPGGFRSMAGLQSLYRELLFRFPTSQDFDELPLPYRAVATDLGTGAPVALGSGDLVEAMLASMAVPGVFPPRVIDGRTLVDGGLASQLPVSVAHVMGADLIIALDTTVEPPAPGAKWSVGQVTQQLIRLTVWGNWQRERARMGERDVLVQADISGLTTSSFQLAEEGFASGEAAARTHRDALLAIKRLAAPSPAPVPAATPPRPSSLAVDNASVVSEELLVRRFGYTADVLDDPQRLRRKLRDLAAFGPFGEADLSLEDADTARLTVRPLPLGRNLFNAGLQASTNLDGDSRYAVLGRYSRRPLGPTGSELRVSAKVGSDLGLGVELYQPFGPESRFFVLPAAAYRAEELLFDLEDTRIAELWQQTGELNLRLGRELGDWGILALDGLYAHIDTENKLSVAPLADSSEQYAGGGFLFAMDTLDQPDWPLQGVQLHTSVKWLNELGAGSGDLTTRYRINAMAPLRFDRFGTTLRFDVQGVDTDDGNPSDILRLGGFRRLSSYPENSLLSDHYALASIETFYRFGSTEALLSVPIYVGALVEYADVRLDLVPGFDDEYLSLAGYLGIDTALGPFYVGAGFGSDDARSVFMHFGYSF